MECINEIAELQNKKVLVRVDFDVPVNDNLEIEDTTRIEACCKTIQYLMDNNAKVCLITKIGDPEEQKMSTKILVPALEKIFKIKVTFLPYCFGPLAESTVSNLKKGQILLLENVRFYKEEKEENEKFAKKLATGFDVYVNEAFAMCHRKDASISLVPKFLPSFAGFRLVDEIESLSRLLKNPAVPFVAIMGGAKVETKLPVIENMSKIASIVLVGGKLPFETNLKIPNLPNIVTPIDNLDQKDIGPKTIKAFEEIIQTAKTIVWNGPMGLFEEPKYSIGTKRIAEAVANSQAYKVIGGGDTISAVQKEKLLNKIDFVSMGGGAMLMFLSGKTLPGVIALEKWGVT